MYIYYTLLHTYLSYYVYRVCTRGVQPIYVSFCTQTIMRSGEGITATDGTMRVSEATCDQHRQIAIRKKRAIKKSILWEPEEFDHSNLSRLYFTLYNRVIERQDPKPPQVRIGAWLSKGAWITRAQLIERAWLLGAWLIEGAQPNL